MHLRALSLPLAVLGAATLACGEDPGVVARSSHALSLSGSLGYVGSSLKFVSAGTYDTSSLYVASYSTSWDPYAGIGPNGPSYSSESCGLSVGSSWASNVGATFEGALDDGGTADVVIVAQAQGLGLQPDVLHYQILVRDQGAGTWQPLCPADASGWPGWAVAVPGEWDTREGHVLGGSWNKDRNQVSFACAGSTIEKCVELGYGVELVNGAAVPSAHMLACVRALRADYCGDGRSWTVSGTVIDMWDEIGVLPRSEPSWTLEANWGRDGAVCVSDLRVAEAMPECLAARVLPACSSSERSVKGKGKGKRASSASSGLAPNAQLGTAFAP